jgi:hypothetical protein
VSETLKASTFIIRVVHEPAGGISGVVERVRTGLKTRFDGGEGLCRVIREIVLQEKGTDDEPR